MASGLLFVCIIIYSIFGALPATSAGLLPWGKVQYSDANGAPCVGCTVTFFIPTTTSPKDTWQDADETILNTNPVVLDSLGTATIYGVGTYRQILKDATGVTLWDAITADPVSLNPGWGGLSTGSANAQAITVGNYSAQDGQVVYWLAGFTNTTATTLDVSGNGATAVVRDSSAGPVALTGGEIVVGNVVGAIYSSTTGQFHLITPTPIQSFDGAVFFNGYITPTILAADQNDWTPSGGFTTANTVRVSSNAAINITGLAGGAAGRQVSFQNVGSFAITFVANSTLSVSGNRFLFSNSVVLNPNDSLTVQYDVLSSGWRDPSAPAPLYQSGYIFGCTLSNNVGDATNDIDVTACATRASSTVVNINTIAMTKRLDADWAAGTNQGMRYSGSVITNTTYHVFTISTAAGVSDYFAYTGTDPIAVLPAGYVNYRRIGSIIRSGATILAFSQMGDEFLLSIPVIDVNATNPGVAAVSRVLTVPLGIKVRALTGPSIIATTTGAGLFVYLSSLDTSDAVPGTGTAVTIISQATGPNGLAAPPIRTDINGQIRSRLGISGVSDNLRVLTYGWLDSRGQDQ